MTASTDIAPAESRARTTISDPRTVRFAGFTFRVAPRNIYVGVALVVLTFAVGTYSIMVGDYPMSVGQVFAAMFGTAEGQGDFIVMTLRLPRAITGALVGMALGISGAVFQSLARNPLGSPDIIGFNSGAAAGAVLVIIVFNGSTWMVAGGAVAGGLTTALIVFGLSWRRGVLSTPRLVLIGLGVGFAMVAVVDYLLTRANINDVQRAAVWLTGSLNGRSWDHVVTVGAALVVLAPLIIGAERSLNRLALGDDTAAGLGVRIGLTKLSLVILAVGLAALAVAAAGPVIFVAFGAGPIARRLVASPNACTVIAGLVGALIVVTADVIARRIMAPTELPVGIATAVLGAPYLLWLLTRGAKAGAL